MTMKQLHIDFEANRVTVTGPEGSATHPLDTAAAFAAVSDAWLRAGWDVKYVYSFTWLGRPIIQLPEDMFRLQEVIWNVQPDVLLECGVAHGGGLVFYAGLCQLMGHGRVIGVDVEIRPHNRAAIDAHPLRPLITLIEGSSIDPPTIKRVREEVRSGERVMVFLDSCHDKAHVLAELEAYHSLVGKDSYLVAMDGIRELVAGGPRTKPDWTWNNPKQAALEFVAKHPEFRIEEPPFRFNEGVVEKRVTYWPGAFLRRVG
jgi:cephalosporin hydroxylase